MMTLRSWLFWVVMQRMSVTWYQHSLLIYPEEQSPQLYGGGSLNIKMTFFFASAAVILSVAGRELVPR